jgi:hypothetical protein
MNASKNVLAECGTGLQGKIDKPCANFEHPRGQSEPVKICARAAKLAFFSVLRQKILSIASLKSPARI